MDKPVDRIFTASVKATQQRLGSRKGFARREAAGSLFRREIDDNLAAFIAERDSFFLATASAEGQPTVQHRGGPRGFLVVLDPTTLAFADFAGNRQYLSVGNLAENDRVCLFLMDWANRQRVKIWGRARVVEDDAALAARLAPKDYPAKVERAIVISIEAWDINCQQHIAQRFSEEELAPALARIDARIAELERENAALKAELAGSGR
ncbi:MAG: pyridoxamine 5'-phosphate oxidase [Alphaproteobacteria bacterium]|nr:pyridoxamine 5'-phosphate oxidase [Alphaproteobacteria bacterium]